MGQKTISQRALVVIFILTLLVAFLVGYRYFSIPQQEFVTEALPTSEHEISQSKVDSMKFRRVEQSISANESTSATTPEPKLETEMEDYVDLSSGFSGRIPLLSQKRRLDSNTFITRDDLPEELRRELDQAMESYERNGYLETDESYIENMNLPYNEVEPFDLNSPALTIEAEKLEETPLADMEYIGVIPDRVSDDEGSPVPGMRRVFKHEAGYISLHEADLKTSEALLQKEFVNRSIKGYPATQITYCAPSMRCVTQLSWLTNDKRYELSLRGDIKALGENELVTIASSLDLPATPQSKRASE